MKTILASLVALGLLAGAAQARVADGYFTGLGDVAPRSVFDDVKDSAPLSPFADLRDTAPRWSFEDIGDSAPRAAADGSATHLDLTGE